MNSNDLVGAEGLLSLPASSCRVCLREQDLGASEKRIGAVLRAPSPNQTTF